MYEHLLIATDGSLTSDKALAHGFALAKALSARVTVATITESWTEAAYATLPTPSMIRAYEKAAAGNAATILDSAKKAAEQAGVQCETRHIKDQYAAEGIVKATKDEGCDLVIVGSHGRAAVGRILLGSTSLKVLTSSPVAVPRLPLDSRTGAVELGKVSIKNALVISAFWQHLSGRPCRRRRWVWVTGSADRGCPRAFAVSVTLCRRVRPP
jgi:nucleotide-binding universal stress UspA family protein